MDQSKQDYQRCVHFYLGRYPPAIVFAETFFKHYGTNPKTIIWRNMIFPSFKNGSFIANFLGSHFSGTIIEWGQKISPRIFSIEMLLKGDIFLYPFCSLRLQVLVGNVIETRETSRLYSPPNRQYVTIPT